MLGILLLNDDTNAITPAIVKECHYKALDINLEILTQWIKGKGRPVTWETLVEVLDSITLSELAREISDSLQ